MHLDEFLIPSAAGSGGLLFYSRSPVDRAEPIEQFTVRLTDQNLSAVAQVYAGYNHSHPGSLFAELARRWTGWPHALIWKSLESELALRCSHDRLGHISIHIELWSGPYPNDWRVAATVMSEAGQLQDIARRAASFFGQTGESL